MNEADALELVSNAVWVTLMVSAPLVLPTMVAGLAIAFVQALTQVQEATLTFVPKMVIVFFAAILAATYIASHLFAFTEEVYGRIATGF
jgi:flagellar biosynthesis protein FliQ